MQRDLYTKWLAQSNLCPRAQADAKSRCIRVERDLQVDLDVEYKKDGGKSLVSLLEYTQDDKRNGRPAPSGLMFNGDIKAGMASLKSAVNNYFLFCRTK